MIKKTKVTLTTSNLEKTMSALFENHEKEITYEFSFEDAETEEMFDCLMGTFSAS